jgi:carboxy-cis,cis-muconate cyclase
VVVDWVFARHQLFVKHIMWNPRISLLVAFWVGFTAVPCNSSIHNLFVSSFKTPHIFSLSYDDETQALNLKSTIYGHNGHPWLALNHDKTTLYASERDGWSSYHIDSPQNLVQNGFVNIRNGCGAKSQRGSGDGPSRADPSGVKHGETIFAVSKRPPYLVYGTGRNPCGVVISTGPDGRLERVVQNVTYNGQSRVQGMAIDPNGRFLFSADGRDNGLWVHNINGQNGRLDRGESLDFPIDDAKPRRIVIHPSGRFLYVLLQKMAQVAVFEIITDRGRPTMRFTNVTISLIPSSRFRRLVNGKLTNCI